MRDWSLIALLLLLLSGCSRHQPAVLFATSQTTTRYIYPPQVVHNFLQNCIADRGAQVEAICLCTLNNIQDRYSLAEFSQVDARLAKDEPVPARMVSLLRSCQKQQGLSPNKKPGNSAR